MKLLVDSRAVSIKGGLLSIFSPQISLPYHKVGNHPIFLPVNEVVGRQAAAYLREFRRSHQIDFGDALIAATALLYGAELYTRNVKHYPMTDIVVIAPYERGR